MNPTTGPAVAETWAYRARSVDPLVHVFVMRIGSKRPVRVLIRFVDAESEGREEWVSPARLKALWNDVDAFTAREGRWDAVLHASEVLDTPEDRAAGAVFDKLINEGLATLGDNALVARQPDAYSATRALGTARQSRGPNTAVGSVDPQRRRRTLRSW